jgi:hypothetical protein
MSGSRAITVGMDVPTFGFRDAGRSGLGRARSGCVRDGFTDMMAGCLSKAAGDKFGEIFELESSSELPRLTVFSSAASTTRPFLCYPI